MAAIAVANCDAGGTNRSEFRATHICAQRRSQGACSSLAQPGPPDPTRAQFLGRDVILRAHRRERPERMEREMVHRHARWPSPG